jgi:peroxiredoxin
MAPEARGNSSVKVAAALTALMFIAAFGVTLPAAYANTAELKTPELKIWRGGALTNFMLPAVAGTHISLESQRGRVVLVHFFATWCAPCKEEFPALYRLVERAGPDSLVVLAISVAEVEPTLRRFLESTPVNFPVLLDQDRAVAKAWKVSALPSTVILDSNLKPRLVVEADFAWDRIEARDLVEMLGAKRAPQLVKPHVANKTWKGPNND